MKKERCLLFLYFSLCFFTIVFTAKAQDFHSGTSNNTNTKILTKTTEGKGDNPNDINNINDIKYTNDTNKPNNTNNLNNTNNPNDTNNTNIINDINNNNIIKNTNNINNNNTSTTNQNINKTNVQIKQEKYKNKKENHNSSSIDENIFNKANFSDTIQEWVIAYKNKDEPKITETTLRIIKMYEAWKYFATKDIKNTYEIIKKELEKTLSKTNEKASDSIVQNFITSLVSSANSPLENSQNRELYELKIESCYPVVNKKEVHLGLYIYFKNKNLHIIRSFEGETYNSINIDTTLSLNLEKAELHNPIARPYQIANQKALAYDNPIYFPLTVTVDDTSKDLDFIANIEFKACDKISGVCKNFKDRVGIYLKAGDIIMETGFCQTIRNHYNSISNEKFSKVKIKEAFYTIYNGNLSLLVKAKFPTYPFKPFMMIENNYKALFDISLINQDWNEITFIATSDKLDEDFINKPISIAVGERSLSLIQQLTPKLNRDYKYKIYSEPFPIIKCLIFIFMIIFSIVLYGKYKKLKFYNKKLMYKMLMILGAGVSFFIISFIFLTFVQKDNYIKSEDEIINAIKKGQSIYINATSSLCFTCKYNDFLFKSMPLVQNLIASEKLVTFKADINDKKQQDILKKYGISELPNGVIITPTARYGLFLPKTLSGNFVNDFLSNLFK